MRRTTQTNYQAKLQGKFDNRMTKHQQKSSLRHNDEIARINEERRRKLEKEQAGIEGPSAPANQNNFKMLFVVVLCVAVILFCTFRILQAKTADPA